MRSMNPDVSLSPTSPRVAFFFARPRRDPYPSPRRAVESILARRASRVDEMMRQCRHESFPLEVARARRQIVHSSYTLSQYIQYRFVHYVHYVLKEQLKRNSAMMVRIRRVDRRRRGRRSHARSVVSACAFDGSDDGVDRDACPCSWTRARSFARARKRRRWMMMMMMMMNTKWMRRGRRSRDGRWSARAMDEDETR